MKITKNDYTRLENDMRMIVISLREVGMLDYLKTNYRRIAEDKNLNADKMLAWEIYHKTGLNYYHYLNDSHIETAIMRIMRELGEVD